MGMLPKSDNGGMGGRPEVAEIRLAGAERALVLLSGTGFLPR